MTQPVTDQTDTAYFTKQLGAYKKIIDTEIAAYSKQVEKSTLQKYGAHSRMALDAYLEILNRGGKRIRGALTMLGYEMVGGQDRTMIAQAAVAVELIHAYILVIDDICDRSPTRRGGPTAHESMAAYHKKHSWADSSRHFGESIAMNAALTANHAAQMMLANLDVDAELRVKAISVLNYALVTTGQGQVNDIFNEVSGQVTERDVENVLEWKTAHYTFLNPLTFGMCLAGVGCGPTDAIRTYALEAGRAFQITDDILGVFGQEFESGKSPLDDIREGKRTILTVYALEHAGRADKNFLVQMLGNANLTSVEFERCKEILVETGALQHAHQRTEQHIQNALKSLEENKSYWSKDGTRFLRGLAQYLAGRRS
jgi:geranylgeranyl diphosphate synthase type I